MEVNVTKEKKAHNMRSSSADEAIRLIPHRQLSLEQASIHRRRRVRRNHSQIRSPPQKSSPVQQAPRRWQEIRASRKPPTNASLGAGNLLMRRHSACPPQEGTESAE